MTDFHPLFPGRSDLYIEFEITPIFRHHRTQRNAFVACIATTIWAQKMCSILSIPLEFSLVVRIFSAHKARKIKLHVLVQNIYVCILYIQIPALPIYNFCENALHTGKLILFFCISAHCLAGSDATRSIVRMKNLCFFSTEDNIWITKQFCIYCVPQAFNQNHSFVIYAFTKCPFFWTTTTDPLLSVLIGHIVGMAAGNGWALIFHCDNKAALFSPHSSSAYMQIYIREIWLTHCGLGYFFHFFFSLMYYVFNARLYYIYREGVQRFLSHNNTDIYDSECANDWCFRYSNLLKNIGACASKRVTK